MPLVLWRLVLIIAVHFVPDVDLVRPARLECDVRIGRIEVPVHTARFRIDLIIVDHCHVCLTGLVDADVEICAADGTLGFFRLFSVEGLI